MLHLLKLMKNIGISLWSKITSLLVLFYFLPNVLFLIWDPAQGTNLVILSCLVRLLIAVIISQTSFVFDDLGNFPGQIFHRIFPNWDLSDFFFLRLGILDGRSQRSSDILITLFPGCILSRKCIALNVDLDHLAAGGFVRFLHCKVTLSSCSHTFTL